MEDIFLLFFCENDNTFGNLLKKYLPQFQIEDLTLFEKYIQFCFHNVQIFEEISKFLKEDFPKFLISIILSKIKMEAKEVENFSSKIL